MSKKTIALLLSILSFVVSFCYWTSTPIHSLPKTIALVFFALILLFEYARQTIRQSKLSLPTLTSIVPTILLLAAVASSIILNPEGRADAVVERGFLFISLSIITLIVPLYNSDSLKTYIKNTFVLTGTILSIHSLASLLFLYKSPYIPVTMQNIAFTPTGSYLTTLFVILINISILMSKIITTKFKSFTTLILILNAISVVAISALMFPNGPLTPKQLSYITSWSIALDGLKSVHSLLVGVGITNYSSLYTAVKPLSINYSSNWSVLQTSAASELFTLLPTTGIITSLVLLYFLVLTLYRSRNTEFFAPMVIILLSFISIPGSPIIYLYLYLIHILTLKFEPNRIDLTNKSRFVAILIPVSVGGALLTTFSYFLLSEYYLGLAERSLRAGNSQAVYDYTLRAASYSPKIANYHLSFAEVNFRLASALSQKPDLSDADRQTISQLISQSINSAKTAITLRPNDSRTYLALAKIYQNLINVAAGAENYAIENYARTLSLDRANPALRLEFAGLLENVAAIEKNATISSSLRTRAMSEVQTAIQLKKDYSNAYYNLANFLEKNNQKEAAIEALRETLKHLPDTSQDYARVNTELETLLTKGTMESTNPTQSNNTELSSPNPLPNTLPGGQIEIPLNQTN